MEEQIRIVEGSSMSRDIEKNVDDFEERLVSSRVSEVVDMAVELSDIK